LTAVLMAAALDAPPEPARLDAAVPRALSDLIVELLAKDPAARPSAAAVRRRLGALAPAPARRPPRRRTAVLLGAALAGRLRAGAGVVGVLSGGRDPGPVANPPAAKNLPPDPLPDGRDKKQAPVQEPRERLDPELLKTDPHRAVAEWALRLKAYEVVVVVGE